LYILQQCSTSGTLQERAERFLVVWADAFNVMNHPNFASLTDANFGRATQMLNTASSWSAAAS
jgi:hypothetical protein